MLMRVDGVEVTGKQPDAIEKLVAGSYGTPGLSGFQLFADMSHELFAYVRDELC